MGVKLEPLGSILKRATRKVTKHNDFERTAIVTPRKRSWEFQQDSLAPPGLNPQLNLITELAKP